MIEIRTGQELLLENLLSFRGIVFSQSEMQQIGSDMQKLISQMGLYTKEKPITVTHGMKDGWFDIEILLPVEGDLSMIRDDKYKIKEKVHIINAVVAYYVGNPANIQIAYDKLNEYVRENQLRPITAGYNIARMIEPSIIDNSEIEIYVGVNPNIL